MVAGRADLACDTPGCLVQHAIASPLVIDDRVAGALVALTDQPSASLLRATEEVASWVSGQLELAELDESRHRLIRAEVRALRAQISPHFIYNSLGAIASFVRTDPDRARELLLEFADFTRYSFRQHGEFTTLAEELRSIERYLLLEQARFGDRLQVTLQVAPEVLGVSIPFLCLQPLVENAVQHGLESVAGGGQISIEARDVDRECVISIEDNGVGRGSRTHPGGARRARPGESVGLANVDERLRATFGDEYGLVVETAPGAGTRVVVRVPKFAPGVTDVSAACACWSSTTSDRPSTSSPSCSRATSASPRCTRPTPPPRRCGCSSSSRSTPCSSTSRCPASPASSSRRCCPGSRPRRVAVFVTAHDQHAVDAFELNAVDYVLKPVREERLAEAVRRVLAATRTEQPEEQVPVERGGVTRFVPVSADPLRRGRGRLRPAAHRRRQPPRPGAADPARAGLGRRRASCASTARC